MKDNSPGTWQWPRRPGHTKKTGSPAHKRYVEELRRARHRADWSDAPNGHPRFGTVDSPKNLPKARG